METPASDTLSNDSERTLSCISSNTHHHAPHTRGQLQGQPGEQRCLLTSAVQLMGSKHSHHTPAHLQDKWSKIRDRLSRIQSAGAHNKRRRESSKELQSPTFSTPLVRSSNNSSCDLRSMAHAHASQSDRLCEASAASACAAAIPSTLSDAAARTMSIDLHDTISSAGSSRRCSLQQEHSRAPTATHAHRRQGSMDMWGGDVNTVAGALPPASAQQACGPACTPAALVFKQQQQQQQQQQQRGTPSLKHARSVPSLQGASREHAHEPSRARPSASSSRDGSSPAPSLTSQSQLPLQPQLLSHSQLPSCSSLGLAQSEPHLSQAHNSPRSSQQLLLSGSQQPLVPSAVQQRRSFSQSLVQVPPGSPGPVLRPSSNSQALPSWLDPMPSAVFSAAAPCQARPKIRRSADQARGPTAVAAMATGSVLYQQHAAQHVCVAPRPHSQPLSADTQLTPHPPPAGKPSRLARLRTVNTLTPVRRSDDEEEDSEGEEGSSAASQTVHTACAAPRTLTSASGAPIHSSSLSGSAAQQPRPPLPPTPPRAPKQAFRVLSGPQPCGVHARSASCTSLGMEAPLEQQQEQQQQQQDEKEQDASSHHHDLDHPSSRPGYTTAAEAARPQTGPASTLCPTPPRHLQRLLTTPSATHDARQQQPSTKPASPAGCSPTPSPPPTTACTPTRMLARSVTAASTTSTHTQQDPSLCVRSSADAGSGPGSSSECYALGRQQQKPSSREHARLLAHLHTYAPHLMRPQGGGSEPCTHHRRHSICMLLSGSSRLDQRPLTPNTKGGPASESRLFSANSSRWGWQNRARHASTDQDALHESLSEHTTSPCAPCAPSPRNHTPRASMHSNSGTADAPTPPPNAAATGAAPAGGLWTRTHTPPPQTHARDADDATHEALAPLLSCEPAPSWCGTETSNGVSNSTSTSGSNAVSAGLTAACGSGSGCEGPATLFASIMCSSGSAGSTGSAACLSPPSSGLVYSGHPSSAALSVTSAGQDARSSAGSQYARSSVSGSKPGGGAPVGANMGSGKAGAAAKVGVGERDAPTHQQAQQQQQEGQQQQQQEAMRGSGGLRARLMRSLHLGAW